MHAEQVSWGGLTSCVVHGLPAEKKPRLAVVLCHGFGAPGTDLAGLAQPLLSIEPALAEQAVFIFPAGPLDLAERGMPGGRAWWMVDIDRLIYGRTPELLESFRRECPVGMPEARSAVLKLLDEAARRLGLAADRFVLGGFSQGAMLATDITLRLVKPPAGLCILSGGLTNEREWRRLAQERGPLVVLQSHGKSDSILPFSLGAALRDLLLETGAVVDFVACPGDHEIPPQVIERLAHLLQRAAA
jgi:phospholipase/carboxylesterase